MNNKIKSTGVFCLINDYDELYAQLQESFHDSELMFFAERTAGHEYLQWELPGDGWVSLAEGDPIMAQEVVKELEQRKRLVREAFGDNQLMADKVLSVPDDSYIYYRPDVSGKLLILLTAWGYRYPERVEGSGTTGVFESPAPKEHVTLQVIYADKPIGGKQLTLNGFARTTDSNGVLDVGDLPIGYQFDVEIDGKSCRFTVVEGKGQLTFDVTVFADVEVKVLRDGNPCIGTMVSICYWGKQLSQATDAQGVAVAKLPLAPESQICKVIVDGESQQKPLSVELTRFDFEFVTPPKYADIEVKVLRGGLPFDGVAVGISYDGKKLNLVTDGQGRAGTKMVLGTHQQCEVTVESQSQQQILSEGSNEFVFDFVTEKDNSDEHTGEGFDNHIDEENNANTSDEIEVQKDEKHKKGSKFVNILIGLAIALLVVKTYFFSVGILIGGGFVK